jgi:hypothetical protein
MKCQYKSKGPILAPQHSSTLFCTFYWARERTTWLHRSVKSLGMSHRDLKAWIRDKGDIDEVSVPAA